MPNQPSHIRSHVLVVDAWCIDRLRRRLSKILSFRNLQKEIDGLGGKSAIYGGFLAGRFSLLFLQTSNSTGPWNRATSTMFPTVSSINPEKMSSESHSKKSDKTETLPNPSKKLHSSFNSPLVIYHMFIDDIMLV